MKIRGCHQCSVESSAPTIPLPRVRVPSTPSMLFSFLVFVLNLSCEKNENKQKRGQVWPILREKNEDQQVRNKCCQSNQRDSAIRNQEKSDTKLMLKTFLGGNQEFPKSKILNMVCSVMPTQICVVFKRKYAVKQSILLKPIV